MNRQLPAIILCVLMVGCATWRITTHRATASAVITVEAAMKAWAGYVASGKATLDQEAVVKLAYGKYQTAMLAVISAAKAATTSDSLDAVMSNASAAQVDLVHAILVFLPAKMQPQPKPQ